MASRRPTEYSLALAVQLCARLAEGKPLTAVCRQRDMPCLTKVYEWRARHAEFDLLLRRARLDQADTMFHQAVDIADERCADAAAVQRNRLRVDTRKWAAAKMNPRVYGDTLAVGGAEELPPLQIDPIAGAKALAFVLARAGTLIERQTPPTPASKPRSVSAVAADFAAISGPFSPWPSIGHGASQQLDLDAEESAEEIGRIGDPRRVVAEQEIRREPLSARRYDQPT